MIVLSSDAVVPRRAIFDEGDHAGIGAWVAEAARQADRYHPRTPAEVAAAVAEDRTGGEGAGG